MSILEAGMIVCWGASWPVAAYKTYRAKSVKGKSATFCCLILLGYIFGIAYKILYNFDWVLWLYLLNTFFVLLDLILYLRYKNNVTKAQ